MTNEMITDTFTTGSVVSSDGTTIGFRRLGQGPAVVMLHGSMESARSHMALASALADQFTVYLPDRRGRGVSGPYGDSYTIRREVEDLAAVLAASGARDVFGVSSGGLVVLEAARTLPGIERIALYEPALLLDGYQPSLVDWLPRFDREIADGKTAAALITSMLGLQLGPAIFNKMPRWLLEGFTNMAMKSEDRKAGPDDVTMRKLAPTLRYEGQLIAEMAGSLESFHDLAADVLLLGGSKGLTFLKPGLAALEQVLPHVRRVEFAGLDHGGSSDISPTNEHGKPAEVAPEVSRFFARG
jgi:pimeloyl-ACP methyl ester carboxylesterase